LPTREAAPVAAARRYEVVHATAEHGCAASACAERMQPLSARGVAAALAALQVSPIPHGAWG
jgi:hypothetical protein